MRVYFQGCISLVRIIRIMRFAGFTLARSILDTVSLVLAVETLYTYVVVDFGDPLQLINMPP